MAYYTGKGVILKGMDYREGDKIVTIFTHETGKVRAIARGVKKSRSTLRICVQTFCHSFFHFHQGKELDIITQGKLLDFYGNIREDIHCSLNVIYIMEIIDQVTMEKAPLPGVYPCLIGFLESLNENGYNPLSIRYIEMQLLNVLGLMPELRHCLACGRHDGRLSFFHIAEGGMICEICGRHNRDLQAISGESLGILRTMSHASWPVMARIKASTGALLQIEQLLEKYMEYHLERRFKMKDNIKKIKKIIPM